MPGHEIGVLEALGLNHRDLQSAVEHVDVVGAAAVDRVGNNMTDSNSSFCITSSHSFLVVQVHTN